MMTIDKIKHYMNPVIFNYWINCMDEVTILNGLNLLEKEMEDGLLTGIQYEAERNLLKTLLS